MKRILRLIKRYKNWLNILPYIFIKNSSPDRIILRDGTIVRAPRDADILNLINEIFFTKCYSPEYLPIDKNDIVVDIGANVGLFTIYAAKKTLNNVYAYEPFPDNCKFINLNVITNQLKNVKIFQYAISDKIDNQRLYLADIRGGHLLFDHNISGKLERYIEVPTITLKQVVEFNDIERIDFLKIDCEGSEGAIFKSIPIDYFMKIQKIAMEFHDNVSMLNHDDIIGVLKDNGFKTFLIWDGHSPFGYIHDRRKN